MRKLLYILVLLVSFILVGCDLTNEVEGETIEIEHVKGKTNVSLNIKKAVVFDLGIIDIMDQLNIDVEIGTPVASLPEYLKEYNDFNAGSLKEPNIEAIYEFDPDVIIISTRQEEAYNELKTIAPTIFLEVGSETYLEDMERNIGIVAKMFKKVDAASTLMDEIKDLVLETTLISANVTEAALIVMVNGDTISAYGPGSRFGFIHDVLEVNVADPNIDIATHGQLIDYEYITNLNPEIIFVVDRNAVVAGSASTDLLDNEILKNVQAIKNNRVEFLDAVSWYIVSGGITSTKIMINEIKTAISK